MSTIINYLRRVFPRVSAISFGIGVVVLAVAWYAFRPELLFINKTVSEEFPGGAAMALIENGPMTVMKGNFKGLAHETKGLASIYQLADVASEL